MKRKKDVVNKAEPTSEDLLLKALMSGEEITKDMALSVPAVSAAVDKISNTFAMIPFRLYKEELSEKETGKKKVIEIKDDSRVRLVNDETQDALDAFQFKKALCTDYLLEKGGYAYINRIGNSIESLHYVKPEKMSFTKNMDPIFKSYTTLCNGRIYYDMDFLKLLRNTKDGCEGESVIAEIGKVLESAFELVKLQVRLARTGGIKKGFLQSEHKLDKNAIAELKKAWIRLYSGDSENIVVLNNGVKFEPSSATPTELQLNENRKSLSSEINEVFCNYDDEKKFFRFAVQPIITAFETVLNANLLLEKEKNERYYWAADTRSLTKASIKERYEAYKIAKETGWLGLNEIRFEEDFEPIEGLDIIAMSLGDVLFDMKSGTWVVPNTGQTMTEGGE